MKGRRGKREKSANSNANTDKHSESVSIVGASCGTDHWHTGKLYGYACQASWRYCQWNILARHCVPDLPQIKMRFESQYAPMTFSGNRVPWGRGLAALGDPSTQLSQQMVTAMNLGVQDANKTGSAVAGAVAAGATATAGLLSTTLITGSAICPICAPFLLIGAALVPLIANMLKGCGASCVQTSEDANQAEQLLQQNLQNYTSLPKEQRTANVQAVALANFTTYFNALMQQCAQIGGQGGSQCIADRQAGACKWKASPWKWNSDGTFTPAGQNGSGSQCWNWVYGYHDPIAQDPYVSPDPVASATNTVSSALLSIFGGTGTSGSGVLSSSPLLLVGLAALGLWLVLD